MDAIRGAREGRERLIKLASELPVYRASGGGATTADELLAQYRAKQQRQQDQRTRTKPSRFGGGGRALGGGGSGSTGSGKDEQQMFAEILGSPRTKRGGGRRGSRARARGGRSAVAAIGRNKRGGRASGGGTVAQLAARLKALEMEHRDLRRQDALRNAELEKLKRRRAAGREIEGVVCGARDQVLAAAAEAAAKDRAAAGFGLLSADDDALMDAIAPSTPNMKTGRGYSAGERALLHALAQSPGGAAPRTGGDAGEGVPDGGSHRDGEGGTLPPASPATTRAAGAAGLRAAHALIAGQRMENAGLRAQIRDIQAFLKRHGLAWTGSGSGTGSGAAGAGAGAGAGTTGSGSNAGAAAPTDTENASAGAEPTRSAEGSNEGGGAGSGIDLGALLVKLEELSAAASSRVAKAAADGTFNFGSAAAPGGGGRTRMSLFDRGSRAVTAASVPLTVYQDGLFLWRGPFRPFTERTARAFANDVLAGYCPEEFRVRGGCYTHGVVFAPLTDRTNETFAAAEARVRAQEAAMGPAARAAAARRARMVVVGGDRGGKKRGGGDDQLRALGVDELLRRVPKTQVARGGEIVALREKMAALLRRQRGKR